MSGAFGPIGHVLSADEPDERVQVDLALDSENSRVIVTANGDTGNGTVELDADGAIQLARLLRTAARYLGGGSAPVLARGPFPFPKPERS